MVDRCCISVRRRDRRRPLETGFAAFDREKMLPTTLLLLAEDGAVDRRIMVAFAVVDVFSAGQHFRLNDGLKSVLGK